MRTAFLLGAVGGIALGLIYAWVLAPVEFTTADPVHIQEEYREVWIVMAAEAYMTSGDWERTQTRLNGLEDANLAETVSALFERYSPGAPNRPARALARLADKLGAERSAAMLVYLATPITTPTATRSPVTATRASTSIATDPSANATSTPRFSFPTPTPTSTPTPEFVVISSDSVCRVLGTPQIRVTVQDSEGNGLSGVDVWITWNGGADRFVTGLKPEFGLGYGDFDMTPAVSYRVGAGIQSALALVSSLRSAACTTDVGDQGRVSWEIVLSPRSN